MHDVRDEVNAMPSDYDDEPEYGSRSPFEPGLIWPLLLSIVVAAIVALVIKALVLALLRCCALGNDAKQRAVQPTPPPQVQQPPGRRAFRDVSYACVSAHDQNPSLQIDVAPNRRAERMRL